MSKLLASLLFAACLCLAFTSGSSIYRDQTEDKDFLDGRQNGEREAMSTLDDESEDESEDQERDNLMTRFIDGLKTKVNTAREYWNEAEGDASQEKVSDESDEQKESSLLPRGLFDKVTTSVTNAGNKAQGYVDTAKAKVGEVKDKVSKIKVPGIGKRNMDKLQHVMKRYMGTLGVSEDDFFNFLKKRQEYRNPAKKSDAVSK